MKECFVFPLMDEDLASDPQWKYASSLMWNIGNNLGQKVHSAEQYIIWANEKLDAIECAADDVSSKEEMSVFIDRLIEFKDKINGKQDD